MPRWEEKSQRGRSGLGHRIALLEEFWGTKGRRRWGRTKNKNRRQSAFHLHLSLSNWGTDRAFSFVRSSSFGTCGVQTPLPLWCPPISLLETLWSAGHIPTSLLEATLRKHGGSKGRNALFQKGLSSLPQKEPQSLHNEDRLAHSMSVTLSKWEEEALSASNYRGNLNGELRQSEFLKVSRPILH